MAIPGTGQLINTIIQKINPMAESMFAGEANSAKQDAHDFVTGSEQNITLWEAEVKAGVLSPADLAWQLQSQMDLGQMIRLKDAGMAEAKVSQFQKNIISIITEVLLKAIL